MLSANTLDRTSMAYRKGYNDGYFERVFNATAHPSDHPFAAGDYKDGYLAGKNDRYWDDKRVRDRAEQEVLAHA